MKQLSIVIVSYNVRHFLEQCLRSVEKAIEGVGAEVFVVDNHSVDDSVSVVRQQFPWVRLIVSEKNLGFSKGNNLALRQAEGKYVLLLNPDTVVEEDTFTQLIDFMDATPDAGAVGCRLLNGEGEFLPESKRAFPSPWVAFYKAFGLSKLFPNSRRFGRYHLTYLDPEQIHRVDVLAGCFMFIRKEALDKSGLLDEDFFMYGEDIDLSYRITQAGYHNYYYPHTQIIHYKGESTRKGSLNYVLVFYDAMRIFARKHFSAGHARLFLILIYVAIYFRASLSALRRVVDRVIFPAVELLQFGAVAAGTTWLWGKHVRGIDYDPQLLQYVLPLMGAVYVGFLWLSGAYRRPYKLRSLVSAFFSAVVALATLLFLFKAFNFSRAIPLLTAFGAFVVSIANRALLNYRRTGNWLLDERSRRRVLIVADETEYRRVLALLEEDLFYPSMVLGRVDPADCEADASLRLGGLPRLGEIAEYHQADEVIFCSASASMREVIQAMSQFAGRLQFKIVPPQADYIVGPNLIVNSDGLEPQLANLYRSEQRLKKTAFDLLVSLGLLTAFPFTFWVYHKPGRALSALLSVLSGQMHLVGYIDGRSQDLPRLKGSLLNMGAIAPHVADPATARRRMRKLDRLYAYHYSPALDWEIVMAGLSSLGQKTAAQ